MSRPKLRRIERLEQYLAPPPSQVQVQVLLSNDPDFDRKLAEASAEGNSRIIIVQFVSPSQDASISGREGQIRQAKGGVGTTPAGYSR